MKVLVVGPQFSDSFARNVAVTLQRMGFEVAAMVPALEGRMVDDQVRKLMAFWARVSTRVETWVQGRFLHAAEKFAPDLVLVTYGGLTPKTVRVLRSISPAVVVWYPDPTANLDREYILGAEYQCWFFKEPLAVELFRKNLGLAVHYLPECCNPMWHRSVECRSEELLSYRCDVVVVGNCYYYRLKMIEGLADFDIKLWGRKPATWLQHPMLKFHQRCYLGEDEKAKAFRAAHIVLNTFTHKEKDSVNCRLFEATGCGAFVLTEARPAVADFFEPGREVAVFESQKDLVEKVRFYITHPEERAVIADAGYRRAQGEHTYEHRLRRLLKTVSEQVGIDFVSAEEPHASATSSNTGAQGVMVAPDALR